MSKTEVSAVGRIRSIESVVLPEETSDGAGVLLKRVIGGLKLNYADPFLLLDHFGSSNEDDYIAGFPMHPHRGIETVTYVLSGSVKHRDSEGNEGIIAAGEIQWMTAGSGIIHEEMPQREGGKLEGFQLWVNLPADSKMIRPQYTDLRGEEVPLFEVPGVRAKVIAGSYGDIQGAIKDIAVSPGMFDVQLKPETGFTHVFPNDHTAFAYIFRGELVDDRGSGIKAPALALLGKGDRCRLLAGESGARFLFVHGRPLNERIARYGPFVMNTRDEIATALRELSEGAFVK